MKWVRVSSTTGVLTTLSESLKWTEGFFMAAYKKQVWIPKTCRMTFLCVAKFSGVSLWWCFHFLLFCFTLLKKKVKWNDLISQQTADKSTPPSAEGPQGLGEWRCMACFGTTTWQVPGSMGFVRSKRETKHHLWNGILIDCCSHYQVEALKLFIAYGMKCEKEVGGGARGGGGQKRIWSSWSSAAQTHVNAAHLLKKCIKKSSLFWLI